jgi:arylsulfatase A
MIVRYAVLLLILYIQGIFTALAQSSNQKPNIILMMADDMGYECLSSNGSLSYSTPVLDKMGAEGMRFTQCYSQPLCTPSRVKIMTGRYNSKNYIDFAYLDKDAKTFGSVMQEAGYLTMIAGKWQLNGVQTREEGYQDVNRPYHFGFDEYCLWWLTSKGSRYADPKIVVNGKKHPATIDDYGPDIVSDYVVDFIERNQDKPFFVYYPMLLVHSPFQPTPDSPEWTSLDTRTQKDDRYFKDMVEYTDKIVAKISTKLDELGMAENTILIFTGDNGTLSGLETLTKDGIYPGGKGRLQDNGTNVPLVINWPGGNHIKGTSDVLIEFSDFLPTFADAGQAKLPQNIDGKSFFNLLSGQKYKPRETVFVHYYPNPQKVSERSGCFVRTAKYKLYSDGRFFDMEADKWEKNQLNTSALDHNRQVVYKKLKDELKDKTIWDFSVPHREFREKNPGPYE